MPGWYPITLWVWAMGWEVGVLLTLMGGWMDRLKERSMDGFVRGWVYRLDGRSIGRLDKRSVDGWIDCKKDPLVDWIKDGWVDG